jgi:hypothetical protein
MRWNVMLGMIVAVGSLAATEARAQENAAGSGAIATPGQQDDGAGNPLSNENTERETVNADGTLSSEPNPMSAFQKRSGQFGYAPVPIEMPLVDDPREDGSGQSGQTN